MQADNDDLEKKLTVVFGVVAALAILFKLHLNGYGTADLLDAIKDLSGLIVVIAVFLVANKLFRRDKDFNFNAAFESHLKEWIQRNDYLVSEEFDGEGQGKFATRFCSMVIDHSNLVTQKKKARDAAHNKEKATFVRLPSGDNQHFEFRFNERTFERQQVYRKGESVDLSAILEQFRMRIEEAFRDLSVDVSLDKQAKAIKVSFQRMEQTADNARRLVYVVEFVKTMVLALA